MGFIMINSGLNLTYLIKKCETLEVIDNGSVEFPVGVDNNLLTIKFGRFPNNKQYWKEVK
jgi:hypothetical protein